MSPEIPRLANVALSAAVAVMVVMRWPVIRQQPAEIRAVLVIGLASMVTIGYASIEVLLLPGAQPIGLRIYLFCALNTAAIVALARARSVRLRPPLPPLPPRRDPEELP